MINLSMDKMTVPVRRYFLYALMAICDPFCALITYNFSSPIGDFYYDCLQLTRIIIMEGAQSGKGTGTGIGDMTVIVTGMRCLFGLALLSIV